MLLTLICCSDSMHGAIWVCEHGFGKGKTHVLWIVNMDFGKERKHFIIRVVSIPAVVGAKERVTTEFQLDIILYMSMISCLHPAAFGVAFQKLPFTPRPCGSNLLTMFYFLTHLALH